MHEDAREHADGLWTRCHDKVCFWRLRELHEALWLMVKNSLHEEQAAAARRISRAIVNTDALVHMHGFRADLPMHQQILESPVQPPVQGALPWPPV